VLKPGQRITPRPFLCPYSPKCLEEEFSEVRGSNLLGERDHDDFSMIYPHAHPGQKVLDEHTCGEDS
jgi:hypothetical protein